MATIEFDVDVRTWVTRERDPEDMWSTDSTDGAVSILGGKLVEKNGYDCLEVNAALKPGDIIYLVWAQYGTGDSFGSYGGHYELLEICLTAEEAEQRKEHYQTAKNSYLPWNGYFEWLDFVDVEVITLS